MAHPAQPARHLATLITAISLTAACIVGIGILVALHLLTPAVLANAVLIGCAVTWIVWAILRHEDNVVDEVHATVAYPNRPTVVRDGVHDGLR